MRQRILAAAAVMVLAGAQPLAAQSPPELPRFELFAQGGGSFHTGKFERETVATVGAPPFPTFTVTVQTKSSLSATGRLFVGARYYVTENNAVEGSYSYAPTRIRSTTALTISPPLPSFAGQSSFFSAPADAHYGSFNYVRYFPARKRLRPFATAGLGVVVFDLLFGTDARLAGNFGGGVDIRLHPRLALRAEFRDFVSEGPRAFVTDHNLVPSVGVAFKF